MADRNRIQVTLPPDELDMLRWLAAERSQLPAQLAARLLTQQIARELDAPGIAESYALWQADVSIEEVVMADVVAAMACPGVPEILSGNRVGAGMEQLRMASYLVALSRWLEDRRSAGEKGPAPRLAGHATLALDGADAGAALAVAGGADGATARRMTPGGHGMGSDKRRLSDIAPRIVGEHSDARA